MKRPWLLLLLGLSINSQMGQPARRPIGPKVGDHNVNLKDGLTYVWIPAGSFRMGCPPGEKRYPSDPPRRYVTITHGFWLGETEVTQAAYQKVVGTSPSFFRGADHPVEQVDWEAAKTYCQLVGGRLPTQAEWEYAARGGTRRGRYGELDEIAWHAGNSGGETHPVKQKQPNRYALYDMLGNVWEWTADWYGNEIQGGIDPKGPPTGPGPAIRGGAWEYPPDSVRVWRLAWADKLAQYYNGGFRCALD
jgi:formylglycine-generating enzyme required for sulfatase activity